MTTEEKYMKRCIQLAKNGLGTTYPNPLVGSVIVHEGKIIGEGWHQKSGEPHAEVHAVNSVKDKSLLSKATIYVSLEPCSHFGKTPPCCDMIIRHKIPNVVVGTIDPFAKVAGTGIRILMEAGKNVTVGILEKECHELNKRFFTFHHKKRPYIILKWAESLDGYISPAEKQEQKPVWISNLFSRQLVHKWRTEEQSILVGTQTVVDDNPKLDARDWSGNNPVKIVIDRNNRISKESHIFDSPRNTIIFNSGTYNAVKENVTSVGIDFSKNICEQIVAFLHQNEIQSVIIEGGRQTLQSFIDSNLWDEARVFKGSVELRNGTRAPFLNGNGKKYSIHNDELIIFRNYD
ncbi:bifunctional diaminohydroxyphosphoribosylaminopyrimidine deaminase/5-amino-6-(5-phosphoribosylamino)uracil reductase RibD [Flavobacterium sp. GT3R68]|uniref:bifunctional diaminohydroxyphosphoribosylaminopyrimidine deaminase/5-amino-6-(5-phosphoribosylamino)uracil reductase RibD n=1 Tax=Flavobacterium sp. GT3R68 TaxID=2594437 RepID=UPI000F883463|nr:bifunctional diaminohydroxyphosphoribosylaminopyrimidine deaminase/5-amino-6-(5-phosphoribosylamino)uracil reductase RibD [Flavobacterium sp. GT3R68]RTY88569.1 bifunctional diaminohydroxyphosphoribosylaminopyrimidine deaminase/5-amino-6-(5-phosphoribosylamino)uracil reductase RibD [Flavobacterium sp. GSN2]TRW90602.1 bifunctional diaminohydroxyphosphoribosylaminopyrimidine deaminase/5-amino-6-(5-phosphoribosylamino)uracil reductase RibD [Flavobacterium sp. GT3R68]